LSQDARRVASIVLVIAGAVLLVAGGIALYAREEIFNADRFSRTAANELRDDRVRDALADPLVEQIVDVGPDQLVNAAPLLEGAVSGALETGAFRKVFREGMRKAYRALFERDGDQLVLTIADANVVIVQAVRALNPKVAQRVPADVGDRLVRITESKSALTAARLAEQVRFLGLVLPPLGVLLLAGGVVAGADRRRSLVDACAAVATTAAVAFVGMLVARTLVVRQFESETVRDAARALFEGYLGGLQVWLLLGGVVAVSLAAAASAREPKPLERPRLLFEWLRRRPASRWLQALRAVLVGAAAILAFLEPTLALQIIAVFAGAVGVYYAVVELIAAIAPPPGEPGAAPGVRSGPVRWVPAAVGVGVLAAAVLVAFLVTDQDERRRAEGRPAGAVTACNGYAELCDRQLNDVAFPAAHNAMSAAELPGWYTPNQRRGIPRQLKDGVRALLIDTHYGIRRSSGPVLTDLDREGESKVREGVREQLGPEAEERFLSLSRRFAESGEGGDPGAYLCHVVCELGSIDLVQGLSWIREFLETHPDEVLLLFVEDKVSPQDAADAFERAGLIPYAYVHKAGAPFPTLRRMINSDKRLFVMAEVTGGGEEIPWYHAGFELTQETPYTFNSPQQLQGPASCDPNRGDAGNPLFQLNHWVEKLPRSPDTAARVNAFDFLGPRARSCAEQRGLVPNFVAVDFYDRGDLFEVANVLNGLPREARPEYRQID
jgi:hypothetical protein